MSKQGILNMLLQFFYQQLDTVLTHIPMYSFSLILQYSPPPACQQSFTFLLLLLLFSYCYFYFLFFSIYKLLFILLSFYAFYLFVSFQHDQECKP
jgi:hypothetical protein